MTDQWGARAIETEYAGVRFRSRLEARHAVFFDALELKWEYEPEGFELGGKAGRYLPDFWLSAQACWLEVKPDRELDRDAAMPQTRRCAGLCAQTNEKVVLSQGIPAFEEAVGLFVPDANANIGCRFVIGSWARCLICGAIAVSDGEVPAPCGHRAFGSTRDLQRAFAVARRHRFWEGG